MTNAQHNREISELATLISKERAIKSRPKFSDQIKMKVRALIRAGVKGKELMAATGLSSSTIFKWGRLDDPTITESPQELKILSSVSHDDTAYPVLLKLKTSHFEVTIYKTDETIR